MSDKAVVKAKSLEERIAEKMADMIGNLITPDDMLKMVERGIEKALFTQREEKSTSYGRSTTVKPCLVDELVNKHLTSQMNAAVERWLTENPEKIQEAMDKAIDGGVLAAIQRAMDSRFSYIFDGGISNLQASGYLPSPDNV